jgi:hypothetical protein
MPGGPTPFLENRLLYLLFERSSESEYAQAPVQVSSRDEERGGELEQNK